MTDRSVRVTPKAVFAEDFQDLTLGNAVRRDDMIVVQSPAEIREYASDPTIRTILWSRSTAEWIQALESLHDFMTKPRRLIGAPCGLIRKKDGWNGGTLDSFEEWTVPYPQAVEGADQLPIFKRLAKELPAVHALLASDRREIFSIVSELSDSGELSYFLSQGEPTPLSRKNADYQLHYHPGGISVSVDYNIRGAGALIARNRSVSGVQAGLRHQNVPVTTSEPPLHLLPNVVAIMKGGMRTDDPAKIGTVHCSPCHSDPLLPFDFRLALIAYARSKKVMELSCKSK